MSSLADYDKLLARTTVVVVALICGFFAFIVYTVQDDTRSRLQSENLSLIDKNSILQSENDELKRKLEFLESTDVPSDLNIKKVTRGIRNKNPMNVVALSSKNPWLGQIGHDSQYHAVFETYEHGLRAGYGCIVVLQKIRLPVQR